MPTTIALPFNPQNTTRPRAVGSGARAAGGVSVRARSQPPTGGLARADGQAAEQALAGAPRKEVLLGRQFNVRFAYPQEKTLRHLLVQHTGRVLEQDYGAEINWCVWLPHSRWAGFEARLEELTAGQVHLAPVEAQTD